MHYATTKERLLHRYGFTEGPNFRWQVPDDKVTVVHFLPLHLQVVLQLLLGLSIPDTCEGEE